MKASLDSTIFNVIIVTPVYNDFAAFATLARDLGSASQPARIRLSIVAVDDGSLQTADVPAALPTGIDSLEIRRLVCNLGHQRAIAVGLASVASLAGHHAVVVMDCDSEDRPADLLRLLAAHRCDPSAAVVFQPCAAHRRAPVQTVLRDLQGHLCRRHRPKNRLRQLHGDPCLDCRSARTHAGDLEPPGRRPAPVLRAHRARAV